MDAKKREAYLSTGAIVKFAHKCEFVMKKVLDSYKNVFQIMQIVFNDISSKIHACFQLTHYHFYELKKK